VIGGGMTAVDAAVQSRLLGAEQVTIAYRRGSENMGASKVEQEWAQTNGVSIRHWATPKAVTAQGVLFATGDEEFLLEADMVLRAIGQKYLPEAAGNGIELKDGRILTDEQGRTGLSRVWAGGDCRFGGRDLTVEAVEHGKQAAIDIDLVLSNPEKAHG
jgi:glutamate synthase (NADPH/NADH) small chain